MVARLIFAVTWFISRNETVQAIRKGSKTPLSILIVGVGHANFGNVSGYYGNQRY